MNTDAVYDQPLGLTEVPQIQKLDAQTGQPFGQDDAEGLTLAGARFSWLYYDGYYLSAEQAAESGPPTRTWILETKAGGLLRFSDLEAEGNYLAEGSNPLYHDAAGQCLIPLGTVIIFELSPPPGYLLPDPNPVAVLQISEVENAAQKTLSVDGEPVDLLVVENTWTILEEPRVLRVQKEDIEDETPVPDTEFTLYRETEPGSDIWTEQSLHITDADGKCDFAPIAIGSYKLVETRPNPLYAEAEESGGGERHFEVLPSSTGEVQVFADMLIQLSCEVYKQTIAITS